MYERKVTLLGSDRTPMPGARRVGAADPSREITVTVYVRPNPAAAPSPVLEEYALAMPGQRREFRDAEIEAMYGANPTDMQAVEAFAAAHNLEVLNRSLSMRSVHLRGTIGDVARAFSVDLGVWEHPEGQYRGRTGPISVPAELHGIITGVFGLDNRRIGRSYRRGLRATVFSHAASNLHGYLPTEVARAYHFPP
jgi:kumamolisin